MNTEIEIKIKYNFKKEGMMKITLSLMLMLGSISSFSHDKDEVKCIQIKPVCYEMVESCKARSFSGLEGELETRGFVSAITIYKKNLKCISHAGVYEITESGDWYHTGKKEYGTPTAPKRTVEMAKKQCRNVMKYVNECK